MHRPNVNTILQHLVEAPRTVRDEASMTWKTLVEPQPDGKVMLVWQSRQKTDFATDGYVWLDAERSQLHREGRHVRTTAAETYHMLTCKDDRSAYSEQWLPPDDGSSHTTCPPSISAHTITSTNARPTGRSLPLDRALLPDRASESNTNLQYCYTRAYKAVNARTKNASSSSSAAITA